jgi:cytoskeletal protein RodZ
MKLSRFTLSIITMLAVVAVVTALSVLNNDSPSASRYTSELDPLGDHSSAESSLEATGTDLSDPSAMATEAALAPLANSVRSRQERASQPPDTSTSSEGDDGGAAATPVMPAPAPPTGLSLAERKAFYWELIEAQDRAVAEAEKAHPMDSDPPQVDDYVALWLELTKEYEGAVMEKYGVTQAQADAIVDEGITSGWPMPPLPEPL